MPPQVSTERQGGLAARLFVLIGRVQGLGVRPAIARLAARLALKGTVANGLEGVEVLVEGDEDQLALFDDLLLAALPTGALVERVERQTALPAGHDDFQIAAHHGRGAVAALVPRDVAVCPKCLAEVRAPSDRRHGYAFTSCTRCGPRYSIVGHMPYERELSSMSGYSQCPQCQSEYETADDRRFHSQTNSCAECGPRIWCVDSAHRQITGSAIEIAVAALKRGEIVALRGLGGYQLVCDATDDDAVSRLRERKRRPAKPLAVMVESPQSARAIAWLEDQELRTLASVENPIVLLKSRSGCGLATGIHPELAEVGVLLPTTPLHVPLASAIGRPLVVTSGNREGEPLAIDIAEAERDLAGIADLWLHHDRPIVRPVDDSVIRVIAGRAVTIRCARGLAPLPLAVASARSILALGGHQKGAIALSNGRQSVLGPHVGDLDSVATQERFLREMQSFIDLYGAAPDLVVHDLHPNYFTTRWAHDQPLCRLAVQHHHAHVAAAMVEHGWLDREVLGIAFDGTGFGTDGTIWGGEFLLATAGGFRRVGRLRPFALPGGEAAIRQPWRISVDLIADSAGAERALCHSTCGWRREDVMRILAIRESDRFAPRTSSVGRLFDAVAALVLKMDQVHYEGQPAMLLESACDPSEEGRYAVPIRGRELLELDWRPMICEILADLDAAVPPPAIAMRFHRGLAAAAAAVARRFAPLPVVLCGGSFQNRLLTELIASDLEESNQPVGLPGTIPTNDGGLAVGQLAVAIARLATNGGV